MGKLSPIFYLTQFIIENEFPIKLLNNEEAETVEGRGANPIL